MIILFFFTAYLLGSFPTAVITGYIVTGKDIRSRGSGNAGATNVFRVLGAAAAIPVLLVDFSKAFFPVFFSSQLAEFAGLKEPQGDLLKIILILVILLGHAFPIWVGFRGGKGVASAAGGISALFPPAVPFCLAIFVLTAALSGYVSLASLMTALILPIFYLAYQFFTSGGFSGTLILFFLLVSLLITILHRKNIRRLLKGEENKIGRRLKKK